MLIQLFVITEEAVADSETETDGEEFSYLTRVTYPDLTNRVSPHASLGMD